MSPETARIEPLQAPFEPAVSAQLERMMVTREFAPIALFRLMTRNLPMARASWQLGAYGLGEQLTLSAREREILIDRTCARLGCEYEWGVHVAYFAPRVGLTSEQVSSLTHGSSADACWASDRERLVIDLVDSLTASGDVPDPLWAALAGSFSEAELLDLLVLTGWYHAICFVARAVRLPGEKGCPSFASMGAPA